MRKRLLSSYNLLLFIFCLLFYFICNFALKFRAKSMGRAWPGLARLGTSSWCLGRGEHGKHGMYGMVVTEATLGRLLAPDMHR